MIRLPLVTWLVRPSRFPIALPGAPIGTVQARTKDDALALAQSEHGPHVVVELDTPAAHATPRLQPRRRRRAS